MFISGSLYVFYQVMTVEYITTIIDLFKGKYIIPVWPMSNTVT